MPRSGSHRVGSLEIDEDLRFQRIEWVLERIGWTCMVCFLIAAAWGLLGNHPSRQHAAAPFGATLWTEFDRFPHWETASRLTVHVQPTRGAASVSVSVNSDYLTRMDVNAITPAPSATFIGPDRTTFQFATAGSSDPLTILFSCTPRRPGAVHATLQADAAMVAIRQFVYP